MLSPVGSLMYTKKIHKQIPSSKFIPYICVIPKVIFYAGKGFPVYHLYFLLFLIYVSAEIAVKVKIKLPYKIFLYKFSTVSY